MKPDWPLETERLVLRPYEDDDLENLHAVYSSPDVARWLYYEPSTLGMRLEAHLVENEWIKGEWQSELVYAMLDREWH